MKPLLGLTQSSQLDEMPAGSSQFNLNIVRNRDNGQDTVSNEMGSFVLRTINDTFIIGKIPLPNGVVLFMGEGADSTIAVQYINAYTVILATPELNFSYSNAIDGVFEYNSKGEVIICFWDGVKDTSNKPRILNIDCLPFEVDANKALVNPADIEKLSLFPQYGFVWNFLEEVLDTGGDLQSGCYQFGYAYIYDDDSQTDCFYLSNPINVIDDSSSKAFNQIDGCEPGTRTTKSIRIRLEHVDTTFTRLQVFVIKKIGGVYSADKMYPITITGSTVYFTYTGIGDTLPSSMQEVLITNEHYDRVWAGTVHNKRLYLGNLRKNKPLDVQKYVNNTYVKWVYEEEVSLNKYSKSYKNPVFAFDYKGFMPNEVMAFYLIVNYKNGDKKAYHIPGRNPGNVTAVDDTATNYVFLENILLTDLVALGFTSAVVNDLILVSPSIRWYHAFNTADSNGTMGYWENQNETYPNTDCWQAMNSSNIIVEDFRGDKVRHHRLPSISQLKAWAGDYITPVTTTATSLYELASTGFDGSGPAYGTRLKFTVPVNNIVEGSLNGTDGNTKYTAYSEQTVKIAIGIDFVAIQDDLNITIYLNKGQGTSAEREVIFADTATGTVTNPKTWSFTWSKHLTLFGSDSIDIEIKHQPDGLGHAYPGLTGTLAGGRAVIVTAIDSITTDIKSKVLGIKLENFSIPANMRDTIASFELGYAERSDENRTILANGDLSTLVAAGGKFFKSHAFDLLSRKPALNVSWIETHLQYSMTNSPFSFQSETPLNYRKRIVNKMYVPANVTLSGIANAGKEDMVWLEGSSALPTVINFTSGTTPGGSKLAVTDFHIFKTDIYFGFSRQRIVRTGLSVAGTATIWTSTRFYGGDTHMNFDSFFTYYTVPSTATTAEEKKIVTAMLPVRSVANIGLRYIDKEETTNYPPRRLHMGENQYDNSTLYNSDYHSINNIDVLEIFECKDECTPTTTEAYPYRVHRSAPSLDESSEIRWRSFLSNDYKEMPKDKGEIWQLTSFNGTLLVHHEYSLYVMNTKDTLAAGDLTEIYLGQGDIFDRDPKAVLETIEGYAGCQNKWSAIVTKLGYFFVDKIKGKVFIFDGSLREVSNERMRSWFISNLGGSLFSPKIDNPYTDDGILAGWDERNNRILLTKIVQSEGVLNTNLSFTISYNEGTWISFHSYYRNGYYWNGDGLFSIVSRISNDVQYARVFRMNTGTAGNFEGDGSTIEPCYVELVVRAETPSLWTSIDWKTISYSFGNKDIIDTIDSVMLYNDYQCTGEIALAPYKRTNSLNTNYRSMIDRYTFNAIRDAVINKAATFLSSKGAVLTGNINQNKAPISKSRLYSKSIIVRLIVNNLSGRNIFIQDINVYPKQSLR